MLQFVQSAINCVFMEDYGIRSYFSKRMCRDAIYCVLDLRKYPLIILSSFIKKAKENFSLAYYFIDHSSLVINHFSFFTFH